jgi:D-alanine-D-alanine ligase-like ATP-grasp enzyme
MVHILELSCTFYDNKLSYRLTKDLIFKKNESISVLDKFDVIALNDTKSIGLKHLCRFDEILTALSIFSDSNI